MKVSTDIQDFVHYCELRLIEKQTVLFSVLCTHLDENVIGVSRRILIKLDDEDIIHLYNKYKDKLNAEYEQNILEVNKHYNKV